MKTEPFEPITPYTHLAGDTTCGLTKREYFAGQLAIGFAAAGATGMPNSTDLAKYIVDATDALIAELNKSL